ncbi:hypothetical protein KVT40_001558 [Elsinoe batatas]|uniref:Uncharacterized protein n=1 Tax=Elsinoe batatas TaxID=2601811 RepID=A0A8K0PLH3_9PEZI|nr:hypothetical protein KVT40_001558 [Elsinoe batatas]
MPLQMVIRTLAKASSGNASRSLERRHAEKHDQMPTPSLQDNVRGRPGSTRVLIFESVRSCAARLREAVQAEVAMPIACLQRHESRSRSMIYYGRLSSFQPGGILGCRLESTLGCPEAVERIGLSEGILFCRG